jgi:hypothetical protein
MVKNNNLDDRLIMMYADGAVAADFAKGIYNFLKKHLIKHILPVALGGYLMISGLIYFTNETETGRAISQKMEEIEETDYYKGFASACYAVHNMR